MAMREIWNRKSHFRQSLISSALALFVRVVVVRSVHFGRQRLRLLSTHRLNVVFKKANRYSSIVYQ